MECERERDASVSEERESECSVPKGARDQDGQWHCEEHCLAPEHTLPRINDASGTYLVYPRVKKCYCRDVWNRYNHGVMNCYCPKGKNCCCCYCCSPGRSKMSFFLVYPVVVIVVT